MSEPSAWRISGLDPSEIKPGSPYYPHDANCESGYMFGPWTDCKCLERATEQIR